MDAHPSFEGGRKLPWAGQFGANLTIRTNCLMKHIQVQFGTSNDFPLATTENIIMIKLCETQFYEFLSLFNLRDNIPNEIQIN